MTRPAICRAHDADDPVPGRICGRTVPCPEHPARTRSGPTLTPQQRREAGLVRVNAWLPLDVMHDLAVLCELESEERGLPPARCRTAAIARAIRDARARSSRARRVRRPNK